MQEIVEPPESVKNNDLIPIKLRKKRLYFILVCFIVGFGIFLFVFLYQTNSKSATISSRITPTPEPSPAIEVVAVEFPQCQKVSNVIAYADDKHVGVIYPGENRQLINKTLITNEQTEDPPWPKYRYLGNTTFTFSPNQQLILINDGNHNNLWIYTIPTHMLQQIDYQEEGGFYGYGGIGGGTWLDNNRVLYRKNQSEKRTLQLYDVSTKTSKQIFARTSEFDYFLSPDKTLLIIDTAGNSDPRNHAENSVFLMPTGSFKEVPVFTYPPFDTGSDISPIVWWRWTIDSKQAVAGVPTAVSYVGSDTRWKLVSLSREGQVNELTNTQIPQNIQYQEYSDLGRLIEDNRTGLASNLYSAMTQEEEKIMAEQPVAVKTNPLTNYKSFPHTVELAEVQGSKECNLVTLSTFTENTLHYNFNFRSAK